MRSTGCWLSSVLAVFHCMEVNQLEERWLKFLYRTITSLFWYNFMLIWDIYNIASISKYCTLRRHKARLHFTLFCFNDVLLSNRAFCVLQIGSTDKHFITWSHKLVLLEKEVFYKHRLKYEMWRYVCIIKTHISKHF